MTIEAKIIEDSIGTSGVRLVTMQLQYPRFIHAELMTHRVFSRNASSSRAIPIAKMLDAVRTAPASPIHWGANQPGMQASAECCNGVEIHLTDSKVTALVSPQEAWQEAAWRAANVAEAMMNAGYHKQVVNRLLEPFQHIHVVVSSTQWDNFFNLRNHPDAQPEIQELAIRMKEAMYASTPKTVEAGRWHLPYVSAQERETEDEVTCAKMSAARCARVSYLRHDGIKPSLEDDLNLFHMLADAVPPHASPLEHQAHPAMEKTTWSGNFRGWIQHRQIYEGVPSYKKDYQ